jgi:hypothetical protein
MNTETPLEPGPSALFPDIAPEHYADAAAHALAISTDALPCDADDVLLAAINKLFDPRDIAAQRCMISMAKMLRKIAEPTPAAIESAVMAFVPAMVSTLFVVAPDKRKVKHVHG